MSNTVELYVYDLSQGMAKNLSMSFLGQQFDGIWHTGIVVFGNEYFYGGGVCKMPPGQTPFGTPLEKIMLGKTSKSQSEFEVFLMKVGQSKFRADTYNLITNNCNNLTEDCSQFLLSKGIPSRLVFFSFNARHSQSSF
jgi:desumoylating isopeptidase 1